MLKIDLVQQIDGVTIYGDDMSYYTFYPVPQSLRFRMDNGRLAFKFIKYCSMRKVGDDLFGGLCVFDTEFVVDPKKLVSIKAKLQAQVDDYYRKNLNGQDQPPAVIVNSPTFTSGTVHLNISSGGTIVESVYGAGTPSLFGNNVAAFRAELTKAGATVFEAAMKGEGGFVSIVYDMTIMARLPPTTIGEKQVIEWNLALQGILPGITMMTGPDGNFFKWEDYYMEVDLNDTFFRVLEVVVRVNADFANLPIDNVKVKLSYTDGRYRQVEEFAFFSPDDVGRFRAFITDGNGKYKYSYQVNYKGDSRVFTSQEFETDDTQLTLNVDDLGILAVDIAPGDINFAQVKQAQIVVRYEDEGIKPIERQFIMTPNENTFKIRDVIFRVRSKPFQYSVTYFMIDGRKLQTQSRQQDAPQLYINNPL